jgi:hypothetical protein
LSASPSGKELEDQSNCRPSGRHLSNSTTTATRPPLQDIRQRSLDLRTGTLRIRDIGCGISIEYVPGKRPAQFQETIGTAYADGRRMLGLTRAKVAAWAKTTEAKIADMEDGRVMMIAAVGGGFHAVGGYGEVLLRLERRAKPDPDRLSARALRGEMNALVAGAKAAGNSETCEWKHWPVTRPDPQTHRVIECRHGDWDEPFVGESQVRRVEVLLDEEPGLYAGVGAREGCQARVQSLEPEEMIMTVACIYRSSRISARESHGKMQSCA